MVARRTLYLYLVRILLVVGVIGASLPFWWSRWKHHDHGVWVAMAGSETGDEGLQVAAGPSGGHHVNIVMVTVGGRHAVFLLPYADNLYIMPDRHWFQMGGACINFIALTRHTIGCQQSGRRWEWGMDGKSSQPEVPDLIKAEFRAQGGQVMVKVPAEHELVKDE